MPSSYDAILDFGLLYDSVPLYQSRSGRLIFDVFNPLFSKMVAADGTEHEDTPLRTLPDGRTLRRTACARCMATSRGDRWWTGARNSSWWPSARPSV